MNEKGLIYPLPYIIIHPDGRLPVIPNTLGSVHHRGYYAYGFNNQINPEFVKRNASDIGTGSTYPRNLEKILKSTYGRFLIDLNRGIPKKGDEDTRFVEKWSFMARESQVFKPERGLSADQKMFLHSTVWQPYHDEILDTMTGFKNSGLITAWDNTENTPGGIGKKEGGEIFEMGGNLVISNRGSEGFPDNRDREHKILTPGEETSCDPRLMVAFREALLISLRKHGFIVNDIFFNTVYKGGYITEHYNTRRYPDLHKRVQADVQSIQIEYDLGFTHDLMPDGITFKANYNKIRRFRRAAEEAMHNVMAGFRAS